MVRPNGGGAAAARPVMGIEEVPVSTFICPCIIREANTDPHGDVWHEQSLWSSSPADPSSNTSNTTILVLNVVMEPAWPRRADQPWLFDLIHGRMLLCTWSLSIYEAHSLFHNSNKFIRTNSNPQTHTLTRVHTSKWISSRDLTLNCFKGGQDDVFHETNFNWTS